MKRTGLTTRYWLATLALTAFIWAMPAGAQSQSTIPQDPDLTRQQLANFDQFLDNHTELAQQIRNNPSLVNNEEFVENHPDLQQYLQNHPELREDLQQNPNAVMHAENRYDRREDQRGDRDVTHQELANMDRFMDNHPEIAEQLRKNPSLVDNKDFVEDHPALQQFLAQHPGVREEYKENPNGFMAQEQRYDRREDQRGDRDVTRQELANMDRFMDSHPEIAEQLRKNPSLVDNKDFVEDHPALQQFLAQHPGVREEYKENPNGFMHMENRYDRREDQRGDRDVTHQELANMDRFMDSHPEIAEQLRKNPSLVDNKDFVEDHPALQQFLAQHPEVREEYKENPNGFMAQEERYDRREDQRGDRDVTRQELANMDRFMDSHPEIAEQLHKNPSLVDNKDFVEDHPALQQFLAQHPGVREEYKENPNGFMHMENRYDRREDSRLGRDSDVTNGELSSFHEFLEGHSNIAKEISTNPSLATNEEYLENHSELQTYLKSNPQVREELKENPQSFVKSAQGFDATTKGMPKMSASEPKSK